MKKLIAILTLVLFLFNVGGYYILFYALTYRTQKQLVLRFDNDDYTDEETITLKIPITLPYPVFSEGYQRVNGGFDYQGGHFKLIKQKLENDTLHIVCYRDKKTKRIAEAFADFSKLSAQLPQSSKQSLTFMCKMIADYETLGSPELIHVSGFCMSLDFAHLNQKAPRYYLTHPSPPPEEQV